TVSRSQQPASGPVSAPRPGPISTSASDRRGPIAATIASTTAASFRKCWPNRLRATCFTTARRSARRLAHLDVGPAAQVAQPVVVGVLELLLAQDVARLLPLLLRIERNRAAVEHLDQVHAEARDDRVRQAAGLQPVDHFLELRHEGPWRDPAEVAALRRARVLRVL